MRERAVKWTDAQRRAVTETGANLIVSSAAGAGKTSVLVGRFLHLVTEADPPADVDRILAVTFTEAAARQLKARIGEALREAWRESGQSRLARQILLLDKAAVSTIHAFCLEVVRRNFHLLGLDPGFTVLGEGEAENLRRDVLGQLFEERYGDAKDGRFREVVRRFGGQDLDGALKDTVLRIHDHLQTLPDRERWIDRHSGAPDAALLEDWKMGLAAMIRARIDAWLDLAARARARIPDEACGGPFRAYLDALENAANGWLEVLADGDPDRALQAVRGFEAPERPRVPRKGNDWGDALSDGLSGVKKALGKLVEDAGRLGVEVLRRDLDHLRPLATRVLALAVEFGDAFTAAKMDQALLDFNDLERHCLQLLEDDATGLAARLRERFEHLLVDEYQDTNRVQERILELISRARGRAWDPNFFAVGDVKQSIYRFRLAEPEVFLERCERSSREPRTVDRRIDLRENFRSRAGVIDAVNAAFEVLMCGGESEVEYDEGARLVSAAEFPVCPDGPTARDPLPVELHLLPRSIERDGDSEEEPGEIADWEAAEREALFAARRIRELKDIEGMLVRSDETKELRPLEWRDVVVLLRAKKYKAATYMDVFRRQDIPVYTEAATGYLTATEVRDLMSLLRVIDNPVQDIPLAAVLRSPLVGLSEADLVRVRLADRSAGFWRALLAYRETGDDPGLVGRIGSFLDVLEDWRALARRGPLADLITDVYRRTHEPAYVLGLPGGVQRRANLIQLHERARQFDRFRTQGLRRFLAFVDRMLESEGDFGQPPAAGEAENAVRVMTIHKSKGLEFPVVFLPDLGKQFNLQDLKPDVLFDRRLGIATAAVDPERRERRPSVPQEIVRTGIRCRLLAEELRILYVGMTRAKEHLVLSGSADMDKDAAAWLAAARHRPFGRAKTPLDWLGSVVARQPGGAAALRERARRTDTGAFSVHIHDPAELGSWTVSRAPTEAPRWLASLARMEPPSVAPGPETEGIRKRLEWTYPWQQATRLRGKDSVTKLERRPNLWSGDIEDDGRKAERAFEAMPAFACEPERGLTPEERGTAVHTIFQHVDPERGTDEASVRLQIEDTAARGLLTADQAGSLLSEGIEKKVARFFRSGIGNRMRRAAATLRREMPFTMKEVPPEGSGLTADDFLVVQGVIDALFLEGDGYVLIDYKSDRVTGAEVAVRAAEYEGQMKRYARAVETILRRPVREAVLYFVEPAVAVPVRPGGKT